MPTVDESWNRIEAWLDDHAADLRRDLHGPVDEADLDRLVAVFGPLPDDLQGSLRQHAGEVPVGGAFAGWELMSVERILEEHAVWSDLKEDDAPDASWIPVTSSGGGAAHFVRPDGTVVLFDEEAEDAAPSWAALLGWYADQLHAGHWVIDPDEGMVDGDGDTGRIGPPSTPTPPPLPPATPPPAPQPAMFGVSESDGAAVVVPPRTTLPPVCCRCGETEGVSMVKLPDKWLPGWMTFALVFGTGLLPGVILIQALGHDVGVRVGVCRSHANFDLPRKLIGFGGIGLALVILCFGLPGMGPWWPTGIAFLVALVGAGIFIAMPSTPVRIVSASSAGVRLGGGHADFVAAVEASIVEVLE